MRVTLQRDEELTAEFLDLFSKLIISNSDYVLGGPTGGQGEVRYSQFADYLANSAALKHGGMRGGCGRSGEQLTVSFQCKSNNVVLLLDMSPHMLIYNYGTRSFPLKNLQEIAETLLAALAKRQARDPAYQYRLSIYLFSVYRQDCEPILLNEAVSPQSLPLLLEFVRVVLQSSRLPYERGSQKYSVGEAMQAVLNTGEARLGMKTLVAVSSFHEEELSPLLLFTPHWYTYALVGIGGHFGSYRIDSQELESKLMPGNYFRTKYVFQSIFLENWQMTDLSKIKTPALSKPVTEKFRSVLFLSDNQRYPDPFDLLLIFKIVVREGSKAKSLGGNESVISTIKETPMRVVQRSYPLPADSFIYILRTKYVQGWEPVLLNAASLVENSKFKLRLPMRESAYLYYEAVRQKGQFLVSIYEVGNKGQAEKLELAAAIQRIDRINAYNFSAVLREGRRGRGVRQNALQLLFQQDQCQIVEQLCASGQEWGKYFKLRRVCFRFEPTLSPPFLQEFLNEIGFLLGKRILTTTFLRQHQPQRRPHDRADDIDHLIRRVMLTKLHFLGSIVELALAFLRYAHSDIVATTELLAAKMHGRRFKWGVVSLVPDQLVACLRSPGLVEHPLFHRRWSLKLKTVPYRNLFRIYWEEVLRASGYEFAPAKGMTAERSYYRILELRSEEGACERVAVLRVREAYERENELQFQVGMASGLLRVMPLREEAKGKGIGLPELVLQLAAELRRSQEETIKLLDSYLALHLRLLKLALTAPPALLQQPLETHVAELYDLRPPFKTGLQTHIRSLLSKYYRQISSEQLRMLAGGGKLLMSSELQQEVQGDVNVEVEGQRYSCFLCSPYRFLWLHRREKALYYKLIALPFEEYNSREGEAGFQEAVLRAITTRVSEQVYCRDFKLFLEGRFKGGILKIISNSQFTHKEERVVDLKGLTAPLLKFQTPPPARLRPVLEVFSGKLFELLREFFPTVRVNYYFQLGERPPLPPFAVDPALSRPDNQLFLRIGFGLGGEPQDVTRESLPEMLMKNLAELYRGKAQLHFRFYLKASSHDQRSLEVVDYFATLVGKLVKDASFELERAALTRRESLVYHFEELGFLWEEHKLESVRLELVREESGSIEGLCRYIQHPAMQTRLSFRRIRQHPAEFMILQQQGGEMEVSSAVLLRVAGKCRLQFIFRSSLFFSSEQREEKLSLQAYLLALRNFINASMLLQELIETYELPLQPQELWMNDSANHRDNKLVTSSKKKLARNPAITKKFLKKQDLPDPLPAPTHHQLVPLTSLFRNFLPLNERIPAGQSLQALKEYQVFKLSEIHNLRNTYLFQNFYEKNHIVFHFEEREEEALIREIAAERGENSWPKCKKYLVYYAFGLTPQSGREKVEPLILPHVKEALSRKLFDQVCQYLLTHSGVIQDFEEYFIRGEKKQMRFELPPRCDRDHLAAYLAQNLETYHFPTQLKSELDRPMEPHKFLESMRFVEPSKLDARSSLPDSVVKELNFEKRSVSAYHQAESVSVSMSVNTRAQTESQGRASEIFTIENHSSQQYEQLDYTWLYNCGRANLNLSETFGKALYLLRLKFKEGSKSVERERLLLGRHSYLFTNWEREDTPAELKKHVLSKRYSGKLKRDSANPTILFDIFECVGSPKFVEIEQAFAFLVRSAIAEYYLESYFFAEYKRAVLGYEQLAGAGDEGRTFLREEIWPAVLEWVGEAESVLQQAGGLPFFRYKSENQLFIREPALYFLRFLDEFKRIISELRPNQCPDIPLLLYCENTADKYSFWAVDDSESLALARRELAMRPAGECQRIGFILSDYLMQLHARVGFHHIEPNMSKRKQPAKMSVRSESSLLSQLDPTGRVDLNQIKFYRDGEFREDYRFKRSLLVWFELVPDGFRYGSYNLKPEVDLQVKEYLAAVDCWLYQKTKLLKFIKDIKENGQYDTPFPTKPERKNTPIYELRYAHEPDKKEEQMRPALSDYKLLLNLVFNDFPDSKKPLTQPDKDGKLRQETVKDLKPRLAHHCIQVRELIETLRQSPIDYSQHASYKGSEKSVLQRWGREYISLLRLQYRKD